MLAWSLATLAQPALLQRLAPEAARAAGFLPRDSIVVAWAFATAALDAGLWACTAAPTEPQHLSNALWACGRVLSALGDAWAARLLPLSQPVCTVLPDQELCNTLWASVALRGAPELLWHAADAVARRGLDAEEQASVGWAFSTARVAHEPLARRLRAGSGAGLGQAAAAASALLVQDALGVLVGPRPPRGPGRPQLRALRG